jgi:tetratricopeptide (TPR) repeat protein
MRRQTPALVLGLVLALLASAVRADLREADALRNAGKHKEAIAKYEAALKEDPDSGPALYGIGVCLTTLALNEKGTESLEKARGHLEKLTSKYPEGAEYRFFYGYWALTASSRLPGEKDKLLALAEKEISAALEKKDDDRYRGYLGQVYKTAGRHEDARLVFGILAQKYPTYVWYSFWLAESEYALFESKSAKGETGPAGAHKKRAEELFLKCLSLDPNMTSVWGPLYKIFSGHRKKGDYGKAMDLLRRIIAKKPHYWIHGQSLWELAANLTDTGKYREAIATLKQAEQVDPRTAIFSNTLGLNYLTVGEHQNAVMAFQRAIQKNPLMLYSWENLGHTLASLGQISTARETFKKGLLHAAKAVDHSRETSRSDMAAEAELYKFLFRYYLDQLDDNSK